MMDKNTNKIFTTTLLALYCALLFCSCESKREQDAIRICQSTKMYPNSRFISHLGSTNNIIERMLITAGVSKYGLNYETYTWLDFANVVAANNPNQKFHWIARAANSKNIYQVGFVTEDNWGHFWEVNIQEKTVESINENEYKSREYGHSRLDTDAPFKIIDITIDTLRLSNTGISYKIEGKVINFTGRSICYADMTGNLSLIFENKTETATNDYNRTNKNNRVLKRNISESNPWHNEDAIGFSIQTETIKSIYLDYDPNYVFFTIEILAKDPIGYSYHRAIYEKNLKNRWNTIRNKIRR